MATKFKFDGSKDLYGLFDITIDATESEIRKAYRKKALACHPDKNPDNPKAAELFHELSKALEILCTESTRAAYDKVIKAKKASEIRFKQLDSKRQKLKEDLEFREKQANDKKNVYKPSSEVSDEEILQREIDRLQKEGSRLLEEEAELMRKQLQEEKNKVNVFDSSQHRIKIKWKCEKNDSSNGGYNSENLSQFLKKYGDISALVISSKKKGSALVEFKTQEAGEMAISYEKGLMSNPLQLEWIGTPPTNKNRGKTSTSTDFDFEDLVLRKMRQAEERKRLIAEMMKEDE
ncbi:DNAJC17 family protein [Megaselia abdita]